MVEAEAGLPLGAGGDMLAFAGELPYHSPLRSFVLAYIRSQYTVQTTGATSGIQTGGAEDRAVAGPTGT